MPLTVPTLDFRRYDQLREEALARVPVHTPEWTNFNESDPGVTLVDMFAFLTESLIYRANLIPERNRLKFLGLLGVALQPGESARGFVTISNERGALQTVTLNGDLEVRAGPVPFRTELGLDVLPIETQLFYKRVVPNAPPDVLAYYRELYLSYLGGQSLDTTAPLLYETTPFPPPAAGGSAAGGGGPAGGSAAGVNLSATVGRSLWIALLLRAGDRPADERQRELARQAIANRTLSLGILPVLPDATARHLDPLGQPGAGGGTQLRYEIPDLPPNGELSLVPSERVPRYKALPTLAADDVLAGPGVVQVRLPSAAELSLWTNVDPLEMGVGDFPPTLEDTALNDRLITWLRITAPGSVEARLLWVGVNAATVRQRARVANEQLPDGSGEPDQAVGLSQRPVVPGSVELTVTDNEGARRWEPIDDLYMAGPEVAVPDPRLPPGAPPPRPAPTRVFQIDAESGQIRFGDGTHGARPPAGARLRATYDHAVGSAGNVAAGAINQGPALPAGLKVTNPVRTWGGADPEGQGQGEKQVARTLQHRDRLVTAADFESIAYRTPGVEVGRVEVLPAYSPEIGTSQPGDAAGAVTLMVVPRHDPEHPNAPMPDGPFLDAICAYLDARRLVTTELFLRAPRYRPIWLSVGIEVAPRISLAQVTEAVKAAVEQFLSPLPPPGTVLPLDESTLFLPATPLDPRKGWPLRKPVLKLEVAAVANRVDGVVLVNDVTLIDDARLTRDQQVPMHGLDLPYLAGIVVGVGAPPPAESIPGFGVPSGQAPGAGTAFVPVPIIPSECR
jgi:hypothetical protein